MAEQSSPPIDLAPERLVQWLAEEQPPQLVDVRESHERQAGHIDGSRHIELVRLTAEADSIDRGRPVVFYCRVGGRSSMAAEAFRTAGYEAYSLDGGLLRWAADGLVVSPEGGTVADH